MSNKVVIDSNVIIEGNYLELPFDKVITTPKVSEEIKDNLSRIRFDIEDIKIIEPDKKSVKKVESHIEEVKEELSETDISVLALGLERDIEVITDDYAMQKLSEILGIKYRGFLQKEKQID